LKEFFENELKDANNISLFENIEIPLLKVLYRMETQGVKINIPFLNKLSIELSDLAIKTEKLIFELAGENFNIGSPKQLGIILFEKLKLIDKPKKTKTGQYSTAEEILSSLEKNHVIVSKILHWRSIKKLLSTYVDTLPMEVNSVTGRIHTEYNQATTSTGRLSSNSPNLQNIPIRTKLGEKVRKAFVSRNNEFLIMAADYSQIELRIIASLSNDPVMTKSFKNNQDIHASTAANVYDVPIEDVTRIQRNNAKTVNFGIIYGVSAFGLSQQTDLSRENAKKLIEKYYETYPNLKNYMKNQISIAREKGYVETVLGRRRYLRDINSQNAVIRSSAERNAVNAPIQGSAADIIKIAMIKIGEKLYNESWESKMIIQVHDELVFDVKKQELEKLQLMVKKEMENAFKLNVPLVVDIGVGENWLEAH
jgi:DNA polymerase-1